MENYIEVGQIVNTHGLKGEVKVNPWTDFPEVFEVFEKVFTKDGTQYHIDGIKYQKGCILLKLGGIQSIDDAEKMRNTVLYIRRGDAHLPHGTWFISELIGCEVYDADDRTHVYGTLSEVMQTGANDVWAVKDNNGREYLVPAVKSVVIETDVAQNSVYIRPLKGIFDDAD